MGKRKRKQDRAKSNRHQERFRVFMVVDSDTSAKRRDFYEKLPGTDGILYSVKTEMRVLIKFKHQLSIETIGPLLAYRTYNSETTDKYGPQIEPSTLDVALPLFSDLPEPVTVGSMRKRRKITPLPVLAS